MDEGETGSPKAGTVGGHLLRTRETWEEPV